MRIRASPRRGTTQNKNYEPGHLVRVVPAQFKFYNICKNCTIFFLKSTFRLRWSK